MHGRVEQSNRHRIGRDNPEHLLEILALHGQQLVEGRLSFFHSPSHDHLDHDRQAFTGVEHTFRAAQTDAAGTILDGDTGHVRRIAIGHDRELGFFIGPAQQNVQFIRELRGQGGDFTRIDVAVGTINGDDIAFAQGNVANLGGASTAIHVNAFGAGDASLAHATGHYGGM